MRNAILIILLICLNVAVYSQPENKIYKKIIHDYVLKQSQSNFKYSSTKLIVLEDPINMRKLNTNEFSRFKEKYKKLDEYTFIDFVKKNQVGLNFDSSSFSGIYIVMVNKEQSKNWNQLYTLYPNWNGSILELSNIGFNKERDQAFVYYGFSSGPGVGGGIYIVFEKKREEWKPKKVIPAWAT
jgi:hypothetical protein